MLQIHFTIYVWTFFQDQKLDKTLLIVASSGLSYLILSKVSMASRADKEITLSSLYEAELPADVVRKELCIKQVFLTQKNSVVIWVQHTKDFNNDLVLIEEGRKSTWFSLSLRATPKQLNKRQILVINHGAGAVDQLVFDSEKWAMANVRQEQNVLGIGYSAELFVFTESQSYCLSEKYNSNIPKAHIL